MNRVIFQYKLDANFFWQILIWFSFGDDGSSNWFLDGKMSGGLKNSIFDIL
jgi:hypothetical protein